VAGGRRPRRAPSPPAAAAPVAPLVPLGAPLAPLVLAAATTAAGLAGVAAGGLAVVKWVIPRGIPKDVMAVRKAQAKPAWKEHPKTSDKILSACLFGPWATAALLTLSVGPVAAAPAAALCLASHALQVFRLYCAFRLRDYRWNTAFATVLVAVTAAAGAEVAALAPSLAPGVAGAAAVGVAAPLAGAVYMLAFAWWVEVLNLEKRPEVLAAEWGAPAAA